MVLVFDAHVHNRLTDWQRTEIRNCDVRTTDVTANYSDYEFKWSVKMRDLSNKTVILCLDRTQLSDRHVMLTKDAEQHAWDGGPVPPPLLAYELNL